MRPSSQAPRRSASGAPRGGELQVDIPRALARFVLRVGDRVYLVKDGESLRVLAPRADSAGTELLFSPGR
jgi:hypothetical protein